MTTPATQLVQIEKPVYGGAFLARAEGKAIFVPLTLPGEQVRVRIVEDKRGYATAEAEEIVAAAPERIVPKCPHFGVCGGCSYQHTDYASQLNFKQAILRETLERGGLSIDGEIGVLAGEPWGYRNRARLAFDGAGNPGYRGRRSHAVIPIRECPIAAPALIDAAIGFAEVRRKLTPTLQPTELSLFCNADEAAILASMFVAHRAKFDFEGLACAWLERASALRGAELVVEGRNGQQPRTVARWGADSLSYRAAGFDYRVNHGAFFQVNRWLVDALVERATQGRTGKMAWDLFAGVGLFARKLAASFDRVIAIESAPAATAALTHNLRESAGEALRSPTLDFLRRNNQAARPDLIVVDPPRAGLGAETTNLLASISAPAMVYVSCDPATLARDLKVLTGSGYSIESVTLADLFPQTFHLETVVELRKA
jgi:23S rRNA (uracil1939-C5)-methyltransferase